MKLNRKAASILAFFIGVMSVFAGSKVLLGLEDKSYNILIGLVAYNVIFGVLSIIASVLIWINHDWFKKLSVSILSSYFLVLIYLQFFNETVAAESIKAMIFRVGSWSLILVLALLQPKSNKK